MKRILYIPFLLIFLLGCKSKENDGVAAQELAYSLAGSWQMTETEMTINNKKVWQADTSKNLQYLNFSPEAVLLDKNGKAGCCAAREYNINGNLYKIDPQVWASYYDEACELVNCFGCQRLDIEYFGKEMIMTGCTGIRVKYVKN
ncbi:hypothetical protein [Dyadobacter sp. CY356]|uniref:hypothetical protein n=1 Tax=Dyadobacter sp. CY356 TaxID=2906442 RepID=UPI001F42EEC8|nr:hypothetical protein [Dyadobacter sp. CY356]MCF0057288.1 hypothetical protein [Dyadobacter sp. CY356]